MDRAEVQARLHLPADQQLEHSESGMVRALYDCPDQILDKAGKRVRIIVATHPAGKMQSRIGFERDGIVYELFLTNLPQDAFTAADVVADRFSGRDFVHEPDGMLRCSAGQSLRVHERCREADRSLRVVYAASIRSCRPCPLGEQCQWQGSATAKPKPA